jgi:cell division protein FtsI/penicillin-binding protein 2
VNKVEAENGEVLWQNVAEDHPHRALAERTAKIMRERILANVVQRGTGKRAKLPGWRVFGKTGTSQVAGKGGYVAGKFVGSFLGGAPVGEPRVCAIVVIGEPKRSLGYYGGTVAAPAVGAILEQTLGYMGVPAEPRPDQSDGLMVRAR